jgi:DNA-binding response OmpR family regulator
MADSPPLVFAADDDPMQLKLVEETLLEMGYEVRTAADGPSAWTVMSACKPDLIVLDIRMPGLTGLDLLREIRDSDWGRQTPVLMMTGQGRVDRLVMARNAGATDYLLKPFSVERFIGRVESLLDPYAVLNRLSAVA